MDTLNILFDKIKSSDSFKTHNDFLKILLEKDNDQAYQLHLDFIEKSENTILHERLCQAYSRRSKNAGEFLLNRILKEKSSSNLLATFIHILGLMKYNKIIPYLPKLLINKNETIRYKCIIVLGWLGGENEISLLYNTLSSHQELDYLRGFAAASLLQIWYNHPTLKNQILHALYNQLSNESSELVNAMIIISLQNILNKKFGLKDNYNGEITGNIDKSKRRAILELDKYFYHK